MYRRPHFTCVGQPLILVTLILLAVAPVVGATRLTDLRCEGLTNPEGLDTPHPRLSWQLTDDRTNRWQIARQILVASSAEKLAANQGDLWDSGRVATGDSIQIPYAGLRLTARAECFWKVRIWTEDGQSTAWSNPAHWSMGLLTEDDWGAARWIGQDELDRSGQLTNTSWIWIPGGHPDQAAPAGTNYFRRVVRLPANRTIKTAVFQYTGEDECRGWLGTFDLGARHSVHTVKFNDLSTRLEPGQTYVFGLTVNHREDGTPAGAVGSLVVEFTEGPSLIIPTDEYWRVSRTPSEHWLESSFDDSSWSAAQVVGPVGMAPWGVVSSAESRELAARYLRKEFVLAQPPAHGTVSFSGLGLSELYLNGEKVGDHVLSPAFAQYDRRDYYVTYDLTDRLRAGTNVLGVILGNGRFYADRSKVYAGTVNFGYPKLRLNLQVTDTAGTVQDVVSDASWQLTTAGPITANNDYDGERYDARQEFIGWARPGFDASAWSAAQLVTAPGGELSAERMEPIRVTGTLRPVAVHELRPGVFIYDFGQNFAGWCRLHVQGPAGTVVTLRHAETLQPDGSLYMANLRGARATDAYTLRGGGPETWEPRFTSHGFRFVELTGYPGRPDLDTLEGRVVNDDLRPGGEFTCSNEMLNRIYHAIVWGTRGNYRSLPTDCPQRDERQGWLGDRSEESRGETYLFDNENLYAKWLRDISDAQRSNGNIPDVAPAYWPIYSDNVVWPSTSVIVPQMLADQFADERTCVANYPSMKRWMDHMGTFLDHGIIRRDNYGDWCVPPENPVLIHSQDPARRTDGALLATAFFFHDCQLMEHYAHRLGHNDEAAAWHAEAETIRAAFNQTFFDPHLGYYSNGTQTSCILPLAFGLVPDALTNQVFQHLVDKLENETHRHVGTGLVGGQYLCRVLHDHGRPDLVYALATQTDYPGWGYMMEHGATTIWELWNGNTAEPSMNSGNHVMLIGDFVVWLYEDLAGIQPDPTQPGFKHILMHPTPTGDLTHVRATHESPYGHIASEWTRVGNRFDWLVEIPANTGATLRVPVAAGQHVVAPGLKPTGGGPGQMIFEVGSGKYHITCE